MNWLDANLPSPGENLALEEALLDAAEAGVTGECIRFWESDSHFVVVGYANKVATEVNVEACKRLQIPILRRCSGGGTVLQGPGVLNYALVLRIAEGTPLAGITSANQFIMQRNAEALTALMGKAVAVEGHTDLAIGGLKFSGNAQRRKRNHLLFHGAILLNLDLNLLEQALMMPTLQPDYRAGRSHHDFLTQLHVSADSVKQALRAAWSAGQPLELNSRWPSWRESVSQLVTEKYSAESWNLRV